MEPAEPQLTPSSPGAHTMAERLGQGFVAPKRVTLDELRPDPTTGIYTASKPGDAGRRVDTKAEIAGIRADKERDAKAAAEAKDLVSTHADEIAMMRLRGAPMAQTLLGMAPPREPGNSRGPRRGRLTYQQARELRN